MCTPAIPEANPNAASVPSRSAICACWSAVYCFCCAAWSVWMPLIVDCCSEYGRPVCCNEAMLRWFAASAIMLDCGNLPAARAGSMPSWLAAARW